MGKREVVSRTPANATAKPHTNKHSVLERLKNPQCLCTEELEKNRRLRRKFVKLSNAIVASLAAYPDMEHYMMFDFGDHALGDQVLLMRYIQSVPGQRCGDFIWPLTETNVMMVENPVIEHLTFWKQSIVRLKEQLIGVKRGKSEFHKRRAKDITKLKTIFNLKLSTTILRSNGHELDWSRDNKKNVVILALYYCVDFCEYLKPATELPRSRKSDLAATVLHRSRRSHKRRLLALTDMPPTLSKPNKRRNISLHEELTASPRTVIATVLTEMKNQSNLGTQPAGQVKEEYNVNGKVILKKELQTEDVQIKQQDEMMSQKELDIQSEDVHVKHQDQVIPKKELKIQTEDVLTQQQDEVVLKKEPRTQTEDVRIKRYYECVPPVLAPRSPPKKKHKNYTTLYDTHCRVKRFTKLETPSSEGHGCILSGSLLTPILPSQPTNWAIDAPIRLENLGPSRLDTMVPSTDCSFAESWEDSFFREIMQDQRNAPTALKLSMAPRRFPGVQSQSVYDMDTFRNSNLSDPSLHIGPFDEAGLTRENDVMEMSHLQYIQLATAIQTRLTPYSKSRRPLNTNKRFTYADLHYS